MTDERIITTEKWDLDYMALARFWADRKSKDPSTKVGAVLVGPNRVLISMGYNGFPRGIEDRPSRYADREVKYPLVVHGEVNAILNAPAIPPGSTLYCTLFPCNECAKMIIQSGVTRVVAPAPEEVDEKRAKRWCDSHVLSTQMFAEAGIKMEFTEDPELLEMRL